MKKLLLLASLGVVAASAYADYSEYFTVSYDGKKVENGQTVVVDHYENVDGKISFEALLPITITNTESDVTFIWGGMYYYDPATKSESKASPQFCSGINCYPPILADTEHNIGFKQGYDCMPGDDVSWLIHVNDVDPATPFTETYRISMGAQEEVEVGPDEYDYDDIPGTEYEIFLKVVYAPGSVDGIDVENAAPEYFDMQGVRVSNPENGLYIVKRGSKVSKEIIRK